ncbi:MAG TPA: hypothetical protein VGD40_23235 [Chryseosolibacter sp.]
MNLKNLEFLKEGIKYLGFGEGLNNKLAEEIGAGKNEFQLRTENQYGKDKVSYTLDFRKSDQSDMYFFNKYTATLPGVGTSADKSQTFFIKKNSGVTAKEAYNLLNGRAVNKDLTNQEGEKYNAWLQIDWSQKDNNGNHKFKMIHEAYGFNLQHVLEKHPIKELADQTTRARLTQSLERGNLHQVTFQKGDKEEKMFIEANPQYKSLNVFDSNLKKVFQENPGRYHVPDNDPMKRQAESRASNESMEPSKAGREAKADSNRANTAKGPHKEESSEDGPDGRQATAEKKRPGKKMTI